MAIHKQIDNAVELLKNKRILFVTGAGLSTDSGIPDYRGKGMLAKNPLLADRFITDPIYRKKFWIRGARDWPTWSKAEPNPGHLAIARMEHEKGAVGVVTQNVDGLHLQAGSMNVAEIHGNMFTSSCMKCKEQHDQDDVLNMMWARNPKLANKRVIAKTFSEPTCAFCYGYLKPDVVFFGDFLPEGEYQFAESMCQEANAVIVAGTSLAVGTPYGFIRNIKARKGPVIVINRGRTHVDDIADIKIDGGLSEVLPAIADAI